MIAALNGCGCSGPCDHEHNIFLGELGQDGIDVSTIDFGAPQPVFDPTALNLAPTSFPSLDTGIILEPTGSFAVGSDPNTLSYLENNPLPTNLPATDVAEGSIPLMPESPGNFVRTTVTPSVPSNTAADIAAAAAAGTGIAKLVVGGGSGGGAIPKAPPGYTYNPATKQFVPMPMVAGVAPDALTQAENWLTGKTLISSIPNWGVVGGGVVAVMLLSSLLDRPGGRRRR